jgi:hypothetical protein
LYRKLQFKLLSLVDRDALAVRTIELPSLLLLPMPVERSRATQISAGVASVTEEGEALTVILGVVSRGAPRGKKDATIVERFVSVVTRVNVTALIELFFRCFRSFLFQRPSLL